MSQNQDYNVFDPETDHNRVDSHTHAEFSSKSRPRI